MDAKTADVLYTINNNFYQSHYASFADTRARPWAGWDTCLPLIRGLINDIRARGSVPSGARSSIQGSASSDSTPSGTRNSTPNNQAISVFDLACGNLRFEEYLRTSLPEQRFDFYAVDNCEDIVPENSYVHFQNLDVVAALQQGSNLTARLSAPACDLSVSFGFLHHIPLQEQRKEVIACLLAKTRPAGLVIVTFWQFRKNKVMEAKARVTHAQALENLKLPPLEENDYLLGWKNIPGVYRYCHSFSEVEINQLLTSVADKASLIARFVSDGRSENLNSYLVLKAH